MQDKQLGEFFILELFNLCLKRRTVLEVCVEHIEYHFLPSEEYKHIWKSISDQYRINKEVITLGILSQQFRLKREVLDVISKISQADPPPETVMIEQIEIFIKKMIFLDTHRQLADLYNKQDDEGAFSLMTSAAEKLSRFTLTKNNLFNNVIGGIFDRLEDRRVSSLSTDPKDRGVKIPTGILLELDVQLKGGIDRGDTLLWMAPSGGGKSKAMKYSGYYNSKIGNRVVHIQAEGTLKAAMEEYDTAYIGQSIDLVETGRLGKDTEDQLKVAIDQIKAKNGEIHVKAFEQFGSSTMLDIKRFMDEVVKVFGPIDLLILDYLELMDPGDGKYYKEERHRREAVANGFKNLCMEFDCAGITATQAMDVSHTAQNDSKFVLRREHISEFKGMVKPFSYFVTINGTEKEIQQKLRRIHIDKFRKYEGPVKTFTIATNFDNERFYDNIQTQLISRYATSN